MFAVVPSSSEYSQSEFHYNYLHLVTCIIVWVFTHESASRGYKMFSVEQRYWSLWCSTLTWFVVLSQCLISTEYDLTRVIIFSYMLIVIIFNAWTVSSGQFSDCTHESHESQLSREERFLFFTIGILASILHQNTLSAQTTMF